jgi:hypothetical protein
MTPRPEPALAAEPAEVVLERVESRADLKRFLDVPFGIYAGDAAWVPPLRLERLEHLDPRKNPYFATAEVAYWMARRGGVPVGRISAQVNRAHLARHQDATGHFGFLEAIDDPAVFAALTGAAEAWLKARGLARVVGPFSLSVNDESGLLVDGFDTPPYLMMGHARPYYAPRLEACGYRKAADLIAYLYDLASEPPAMVTRMIEKLRREAGARIRPLDMGRYRQEVETVAEIFNDAWAENWSFVPLSPPEIAFLAKNLRPLVSPGHAAIAEFDGEAVAMAVTLPNVNEAIADLGGRLLPFGWAKLLWRLKVRGLETARLPLMGVRRRLQNGPLGAALALGVIDSVRRYHAAQGTKWGELSWVLEENVRVRRIIEMLGAAPYKTYRMYEKALT